MIGSISPMGRNVNYAFCVKDNTPCIYYVVSLFLADFIASSML
jgi:hypothetical protein